MSVEPASTGTHADRSTARIALAGHSIARIGFGAAALTADGGWGEPKDRGPARVLLRSAIEVGIDYIDTADVLGPGTSESIISDVVTAADEVLVATKVGMVRSGPSSWGVLGRPDYLIQQVHASRNRLRMETIDLVYLHWIDPAYPLEEQLGALQSLKDEGVIRAIGASSPTVEQLELFVSIERPAAIQAEFSFASPKRNRYLVEKAAELGIPFVAFWPLGGAHQGTEVRARRFAPLHELGRSWGLTPEQLALAWVLAQGPHIVPIVGSRNSAHLAEDVAVLQNTLTPRQHDELDVAVASLATTSEGAHE